MQNQGQFIFQKLLIISGNRPLLIHRAIKNCGIITDLPSLKKIIEYIKRHT